MVKLLLKCLCVAMVLFFCAPVYGQFDEVNDISVRDVSEPIVVSRVQSKITDYGAGNRTVVLGSTPAQGNLLVVASMHGGDGHTPQISGVGWVLEFERYNSIANGVYGTPDENFKRGIAVWWKIAGANEPSTITVSWNPDSSHRVLAQEFFAGDQESAYSAMTITEGDYIGPSTNQDPETRSASLGTTVVLKDGNVLLIPIVGWRTGSDTTYPSNISYSGGLGNVLSYTDQQAYNVTLSSAFIHATDGGEKTSTVSWDGDEHKFIGGMIVFNIHQPPDNLFVYWATSSKTKTIGWDKPADHIVGDKYEVRLKWIETGAYFNVGETEAFEINLTAPRVGHFEVYLRTKRILVDNNGDELIKYSRWAVSSNYLDARVNGEAYGWRIYWRMAPPGEVIID